MLERLLEKSRADQIVWRHFGDTPWDLDVSERNDNYVVDFGEQGRIVIHYLSPESAPDRISADLRVNDVCVARIEAEDGDRGSTDEWRLLKELIDDARRHVFGFEDTLEMIEQALKSNARIGELPRKGDIPF